MSRVSRRHRNGLRAVVSQYHPYFLAESYQPPRDAHADREGLQ